MKIKMKQPMSGPDVNLNVGDEIEVSGPEGLRYISAGFAIAIDQAEYQSLRSRADLEAALLAKTESQAILAKELAESRAAAEAAVEVANEKKAALDEIETSIKADQTALGLGAEVVTKTDAAQAELSVASAAEPPAKVEPGNGSTAPGDNAGKAKDKSK